MGPTVKGSARFEQYLPKPPEGYVLENARTITCKNGVEVWSTYRLTLTGTTVIAVIQLGPGARVPTEHLSEYNGLKARVYDANLWVQYKDAALFLEVSTSFATTSTSIPSSTRRPSSAPTARPRSPSFS